MLEIRHLTKTYKAKGGVVTKALDDVSVVFPEKGLVFLLGKSGSGKSTLLNVSGGLDRPDSGEIIIKGKNSKEFSGADFDSYRNTFIGFIFQEYNILHEFNIEQNISLALQLQGKPSDKAAVEAILKQVDLEGFGKRKPNTLSGGQKQRVAIARALIKNPEIIMADEPTGALDSNTGKQVFDTLKKLAQEKLVIVVSHDRDFAEVYGDRIIELSDGKIISDVTKHEVEAVSVSENVRLVNDHTLAIAHPENLQESDAKHIIAMLKKQKGEVLVSAGEHDVPLVKNAIHMSDSNASEVFEDTGEVKSLDYDGSKTKFIRSRLPMSRAGKMGASSLKEKPIRMIFTVLLTTVALTMFGVASTLMLYDSNQTIGAAYRNSNYASEVFSKSSKGTYRGATVNLNDLSEVSSYEYARTETACFGVEEIKELNRNSVGHDFAGVVGSSNTYDNILHFTNISGANYYYANNFFAGLVDAGSEYMQRQGFSLLKGNYPQDSSSIAISEYTYDLIRSSNATLYPDLDSVVGKKFSFNSNFISKEIQLTISGVYATGSIPAEFDSLKETADHQKAEKMKRYLSNTYSLMGYVTPSFLDENGILAKIQSRRSAEFNTVQGQGLMVGEKWIIDQEKPSPDYGFGFYATDLAEKYLTNIPVYDLSGKQMKYQKPSKNEVYLPLNLKTWLDEKNEQLARQRYARLGNFLQITPEGRAAFANEEAIFEAMQALNDYANLYSRFPEEEAIALEKALSLSDKTMERLIVLAKVKMALNEKNRTETWGGEENDIDVLVSHFSSYEDDTLADRTEANWDKVAAYFNANKATVNRGEAFRIGEEIGFGNTTIPEAERAPYEEALSRIATSSDTEADITLLLSSGNAVGIDCVYSNTSFGSLDFIPFGTADLTPAPLAKEEPHYYYNSYNGQKGEFKILGYHNLGHGFFAASLETVKALGSVGGNTSIGYTKTDYVEPADARYNEVITKTNFTSAQIASMRAANSTFTYNFTDATYQSVSMVVNTIESMKTVFFWVGVAFAAFAALMLFNFISSSISAKTKEIGILRAVGARGSDLFKIFFSSSGIIAAICTVFSIAASIIICWRLNVELGTALGVALLHFGIVNIGLIVAGAVAIAIIGTFIPVLIASKKPPIDSIRTL